MIVSVNIVRMSGTNWHILPENKCFYGHFAFSPQSSFNPVSAQAKITTTFRGWSNAKQQTS